MNRRGIPDSPNPQSPDETIRGFTHAFSVGRGMETTVYKKDPSWFALKDQQQQPVPFSPGIVRPHLNGAAIFGIAPPSEGPAYTRFVCFDLDRPGKNDPKQTEEERAESHLTVTGRMQRLFDVLGTGIVQRSTVSGGYHIIVRLEAPRGIQIDGLAPAIETRLHELGIKTGDGELEIFPRRGCTLRLPCSREYVTVDPETGAPITGDWEAFFRLFQFSEPADAWVLDTIAATKAAREAAKKGGKKGANSPVTPFSNRRAEDSAQYGNYSANVQGAIEFSLVGGLPAKGTRQHYARCWAVTMRSRLGSDKVELAVILTRSLFQMHHNNNSATMNRDRAKALREVEKTVRRIFNLKNWTDRPDLIGQWPAPLRQYVKTVKETEAQHTPRGNWLTDADISIGADWVKRHAPELAEEGRDLFRKATIFTRRNLKKTGDHFNAEICAGERFWIGQPGQRGTLSDQRIGRVQAKNKGRPFYLPNVIARFEALGVLRLVKRHSRGNHSRVYEIVHPRNLQGKVRVQPIAEATQSKHQSVLASVMGKQPGHPQPPTPRVNSLCSPKSRLSSQREAPPIYTVKPQEESPRHDAPDPDHHTRGRSRQDSDPQSNQRAIEAPTPRATKGRPKT